MKIGDLPAIRFAMGIESFNFFPLLRVEGMLMAPYRLLWSGHDTTAGYPFAAVRWFIGPSWKRREEKWMNLSQLDGLHLL